MKRCVSTGDVSKLKGSAAHGIRRSTSLASLKKEGQRKPVPHSSRLSCATPTAAPCWSSASAPASPVLLAAKRAIGTTTATPRTPPRTPPGLPKPPKRDPPTPCASPMKAPAPFPLLHPPPILPPLLPQLRSVCVFRLSLGLPSLAELLASCEQLEGLVRATPQQPMVSTMCKMLSSSLGRSCKTLEAQLVSPASWHFSPDASVTVSEFKYADMWTLDATAAESAGALEMEQHDHDLDVPDTGFSLHTRSSSDSIVCSSSSSMSGSSSVGSASQLPRVRAYKRVAVGQPWSLVGTSPACCSDIHHQLSQGPRTQLHHAGHAVLASEPVAVARACKLALQQGLCLKGMVALLQAAADGLQATVAQLQLQQQQQQQCVQVQAQVGACTC